MIVVTPDAERTMNTYLGVSSFLSVADVDDDAIADAKVLYMEGYLYDRDDAKLPSDTPPTSLIGTDVSSHSPCPTRFCVDRHRDDFRTLVQGHVDLLFGNADELCSLYELERFDDAIDAVRAECTMAVIARGSDGCVIVDP